jgi:hypothetical protein
MMVSCRWVPAFLKASHTWGEGRRGPPPLAWHGRQQRLAAADAVDRVHIYDVGSAAPSPADFSVGPQPPLAPSATLTHELQAQV